MDSVFLSLASTAVGGVIGIAGSLVVESRRESRAERTRWDHRRLDAIVTLGVAAQVFEGAHYLRGRAIGDRDVQDGDRARRVEEARDATAEFRAAAISAALLLPELDDRINDLRACTRELRDVADQGLANGDLRWTEARDAHQSTIATMQAEARAVLKISSK